MAFTWLRKLFGAKAEKPHKVTVHFFYGNAGPVERKALVPIVKQVSNRPDLPDSALFLYHVLPWPADPRNHGIKLIRNAGRYPEGNVAIVEGSGDWTATTGEVAPITCLTLIRDLVLKLERVDDVPAEVRKLFDKHKRGS